MRAGFQLVLYCLQQDLAPPSYKCRRFGSYADISVLSPRGPGRVWNAIAPLLILPRRLAVFQFPNKNKNTFKFALDLDNHC